MLIIEPTSGRTTSAAGLIGRLTFRGGPSDPEGRRGNGDCDHALLPDCHAAGEPVRSQIITRRTSRSALLCPQVPGFTKQTYLFCRDDVPVTDSSILWKRLKFFGGNAAGPISASSFRQLVLDLQCDWTMADEDHLDPARSRPDSHLLATASVCSAGSLQFLSRPGRNFGATHGIYRRTALKRCQRKGNRPRGGFRLPWARCRTSAWDGSARGQARVRPTQ